MGVFLVKLCIAEVVPFSAAFFPILNCWSGVSFRYGFLVPEHFACKNLVNSSLYAIMDGDGITSDKHPEGSGK